uniref:KIF-binding protein n=1 Tax=Amphora coffeiformis TaxID=265554 RepID=A0A7S3L570_9STRA|mmetsp:Transcript_9212/g.17587  ORF Transcript_9212/g.17587 Transcript_9212/m.17587 type:complete len:245 (+) Transcript_9212:60-794(+)|eukprot:scaffold44463_cov206-Amphora_coffeaeformis.AAC.2
MEQTKTFNNTAIDLLGSGYLEEAKDMFRAALETKIGHDRAEAEGCVAHARCVTPECIFSAEYHLNNRSTYLSKPKNAPGCSRTLSPGGFTRTSGDSDDGAPAPIVHLFSRPFAIADEDFEEVTYASAVNVFNLGLVHQLQNRSCTKARAFYEVSASLLATEAWDEHSALLRAAVTNNFAVWGYQNNEMYAARASFMELGRMLLSWPGEPEHAVGFQSNLLLLPLLDDDDRSDDEEDDNSDEDED